MSLDGLLTRADLQRFVEQVIADAPTASLPTRGKVTVTFPGASQFSNTVTVTHGLSKTPTTIVVSARSDVATGGNPIFASVQDASVGATTFQVQAQSTGTPAAASTTTVDWVAYV